MTWSAVKSPLFRGDTHLVCSEESLVSLSGLAVHVVVVIFVHAVARVRVAVQLITLQRVLGDRSVTDM